MFNYNKYKKTWDFSISILLTILVVFLIYYSIIGQEIKKDIKKGKNAYLISLTSEIVNMMQKKSFVENKDINLLLNKLKNREKLQGNEIDIECVDSKGKVMFSTNKNRIRYSYYNLIKINDCNIDLAIDTLSFINEIRLRAFGVVILLSALVFLFIRIFLLYREVILFKEDKLSRSIGKIRETIEKVEFDLSKTEEIIENLNPKTYKDWIKTYMKICELELLLDKIEKTSGIDLKLKQKKWKLNEQFASFIQKEYPLWVKSLLTNRPILSPDVIKEKVLVQSRFKEVYFILFDSLSYDQWLGLKEKFVDIFNKHTLAEELYFSVIPTVTSYARNSIFSGMFCDECADRFYHGSLKNNQYEEQAYHNLLKQNNKNGIYLRQAENEENRNKIKSILNADVFAKTLIYMFIDGLAHSLSMVKADESALRKHIMVEFNKNIIQEALREISQKKAPVIITSDHGSILAKETARINQYELRTDAYGNHERVSERFNFGLPRLSNYNDFKVKSSIFISTPKDYRLPTKEKPTYIIAAGKIKYFAEDNLQIHEFVHGGVTMEEMIVPLASFMPK